ncbi:hypothetical protein [Staphylococcus chromogenes]|uniref:hypothetical protein n=1 Tax=Staphylococcus chromogenes TaxID=46126 RepID=UPI0028875203|nr:hypothetical protein [Staphylococcus chromogenes]MDT0700327.1 hypothetical protein [Staphylococcus chromogenes]
MYNQEQNLELLYANATFDYLETNDEVQNYEQEVSNYEEYLEKMDFNYYEQDKI